MRLNLLIISFILFSNTCLAFHTLDYVKKNINSQNDVQKIYTIAYIKGIADGLNYANNEFKWDTGKEFYCIPGDFTMDPQNFYTIVKAWDLKRPGYGGLMFSQTMFWALVDAFPCKK